MHNFYNFYTIFLWRLTMFKYETHIHTMQASACARVSGSQQAIQYKECGYDGIIITDHFFGGNTCIHSCASWSDRINQFCSGYEDARKTGEQIGLKVFFGYEETFDGTDFLIYGVDKEWMLAHPEMEHYSIEEQYEAIHSAGGIIVQAHPFRDRPYIPQIRLFPNLVDAVEVINKSNYPEENDAAYEYAVKYNLPMTCGSDGHHDRVLGGGIAVEKELNTIYDYINLIKNKEKLVLL